MVHNDHDEVEGTTMLENIGDKIKEKRLLQGMTLTELGDKIGVGASTVRKWETGYIKDIKSDKIQKLANALKVTPAYLMGWDEKEPAQKPQEPIKRKLRSVARLEENELTEEEDKDLQNYIDFLIAKRDKK